MGKPQARGPHLMMSVYSRSLPLLSFHFLYITEASTLAGEKVLGSLRSEITLSRMVLGEHGVSRYRALSDPPPPSQSICGDTQSLALKLLLGPCVTGKLPDTLRPMPPLAPNPAGDNWCY